MARLIVSEFVSLNGVVEAPGGEPTHPHSGWTMDFTGDEQLQYKLAEAKEAEALLLGRVTYEGFAAAWPPRTGPFADKLNSMPKYVVSSTLAEPLGVEQLDADLGRRRREDREAQGAGRWADPRRG